MVDISTDRVILTRTDSGSAARANDRLFFYMLGAFILLELVSWPILFSFELWVVYDRGSLLNADYLWSNGLRPGVDFFYSYGLLPLALQHLAFIFGRGYWPMVICTLLILPILALIWSVLLRSLPRSVGWLLALLSVVPMLLWVNPNFPYSLVLVSMLGALALVTKNRPDLALVLCAIGCWSVPSLPFVLTAMLVVLIIVRWWMDGHESIIDLFRMLAPGAVAYLALGGMLAILFGWGPVFTTALPLRGAAFYAHKGYGLDSLHEFLSPAGARLRWYFLTRAGWWMVSTLMLFGLGVVSAVRMARAKALDNLDCVIVIIALLHAAFIFVAPGPPEQHLIYDPFLAGGVLIGLNRLPMIRPWARPHVSLSTALLAVFALLAVLGNGWQFRDTWRAWREQSASPVMAGLYAGPDMVREWSQIVAMSTSHSVLMLTYGTGAHHYFPTLQGPRIWFLEVGQLLPADKDRVLAQIRAADVVVTAHDNRLELYDLRFRNEVQTRCLIKAGIYYDIWQRRNPAGNCPP